jgi:predicted MFS family arabinose efflux permease
MFTVPFLFFGLAASSPELALAWFLVVYGLFWFIDGVCAVSWFDIVAKTIPAGVRGRFFGVMQALCGAAAIGTGFLVKWALQHWPFPTNFAILSAGTCAGIVASLGFLALIREPEGEVQTGADKPRFAQFLRSATPLLRQNPRLRGLLITRLFLDGGSMALPFYILFAERDLNSGLKMVGVFAVVQSVGKVIGGPIWGWLSDHAGPVVGLRAVAVSVTAIPLVALAARSGSTAPLYVVFLLIGAVQDGVWMVGSNALLSSVSSEERPLAVGVSSMMQAPGAIFGIIGGALAASTSYPVVFVAAALLGAAAVAMTWRLGSRPDQLDATG